LNLIRRVTLLTLLIVPLAFAPPAFANGFSLYYGPSPYGGNPYALNEGNISWTGKFHFDWYGDSWDYCPADGLGTSFYFGYQYGDGSSGEDAPVLWDVAGCNTHQYGAGTVTKQRQIVKVRVHSCWTNDGNLCWLEDIDYGVGAWKTNPNV
jgi:hypothetical protein